ncbi:unnamed protein product [Adineta ricciae]|uniref:Uncharacterized protein n=1 Tax=Adineta ricciae TaxID=249248 RepID=A0A813UTA0_ADIRI|nr:unnamed protein product [Adineta ricciae]
MISNSEENPTAGNLHALHADGTTTTTDLDALDNRTDDFYSTLHSFHGTTRPVNQNMSSCCGRSKGEKARLHLLHTICEVKRSMTEVPAKYD